MVVFVSTNIKCFGWGGCIQKQTYPFSKLFVFSKYKTAAYSSSSCMIVLCYGLNTLGSALMFWFEDNLTRRLECCSYRQQTAFRHVSVLFARFCQRTLRQEAGAVSDAEIQEIQRYAIPLGPLFSASNL